MTKKAGVTAYHPIQIPLLGWWQISKRVVAKVKRDNLSLIAAGVAFYFLLAIFPLLAALISLYGLFVSSDELSQHMSIIVNIFPQDSRYILQEQIETVISTSNASLTLGFLVSLGLAIYSGGKGSQALVTACNITYQEQQSRSFLINIAFRFVLTLAAILLIASALLLIALLPILIRNISGLELGAGQIKWITWVTLLILFNIGLSSLYRYGPVRSNAKWRWVTIGSFFASIGWVCASVLFSYYLTGYAKYNETYGSIGGIVILLMWFYITAFVILLGAELNSSIELQTRRDSTTGPDKPIGTRGATVADNVGMAHDKLDKTPFTSVNTD
ncbi:YihY/virulence factor BrkB family protein [Aliiglaciecola sp. LCG003]|uniref:YihY/virulence factor BrkB family protein n=1 Tax=Aliiglaciecola sp. LCG003 TaxID=3053655 RepID=UPI00257382B3|nr:YihY/virulence factor BrkB family protein [Aliiglaciecola sp. LCG003]WJG11030.1 YihY/virulence factor BrkB family protein [Aliiglaciecola sp. LCG003]